MDVSRQGRVVVLGSAHQDLILRVADLPAAGETVLSSALDRTFGGKGANQAVAAAAAGASVTFAGVVGGDAPGEQIARNLAAHGVDTSMLRRSSDGLSGLAVVVVDDAGQNLIVVAPESASTFPLDLVQLALDDIDVDDVVVVQCEIPAPVVESVLTYASTTGAAVVLNLAPFTELSAAALARASLIVVNESEAAELAASRRVTLDGRDLATVLAADTGTQVVITRGAQGSILAPVDGRAVVIPAHRAEAVVDTTGAGDSYVGTLAAMLARGENPVEAVRGASEAAALAVSRSGAQQRPPAGRFASAS